MKKILITGGTVFVSKYAADYFVKRNDRVFVLNRNHYPQCEGVTLIEGDRNHLGDILRNYHCTPHFAKLIILEHGYTHRQELEIMYFGLIISHILYIVNGVGSMDFVEWRCNYE